MPAYRILMTSPEAAVDVREAAGAIVCRLQEDYRDRVELELYFCGDPATAPADQKFPSARQFDLIVCLVDPGARRRERAIEPVALDENEAPFDRLADFVLLTKTARNNYAGENEGSVSAWQLLTHFLPVAGNRAIDGRDRFTTHVGTYDDVFGFERYLSNALQQRLRHRYPIEVPREELPDGPAITQPDHFLYRYGYSLNPEIRSYVNNWLWELRRRGRKERRRIAVLVFALTLSLTTATTLATIWLHRYLRTSDSKTLALRREHEAERTMHLSIQARSEAERLLANTRNADARQIAETRADAARQIERVKDDAEGVLHLVATDLANKLEPVHRLDLLDRSLDSIQNYRASIGRVSEDVPILLWRAGAFSDAADLFWDENRLEEALTAYSSASEILQKLIQRTPADPSWFVRLGTTLRKMGNVLEEQRKPAEAIDHYRRASELFEKALAVEPMDDATRVALDNCLNSIGLLSLQQREWAQALDYLRRHRNVARNLAEYMPTAAARWDNLRVACERLAEIYSSQCAWDSALDTLAEQLVAARHLAELTPDSLDAGRLPAVCLERIARVNENRGAYADAAASYIEELTSLQLLIGAHHGDTSLRRDFCTCLSNLGDVLRVAGNGEQALETHSRAVEQATKLMLGDPNNAENKRELALCLKSRGSALADLVRPSDAEKSFQASIALSRELMAAFPKNPAYRRDLADTLRRMGDFLSASGDYELALGYFQEAASIGSSLVDLDSGDVSNKQEWALSVQGVADCLAASDRADDAIVQYQKSASLFEELLRTQNNVSWTEFLANCYFQIGRVHLSQDDRQAAEQMFRKSQEILAPASIQATIDDFGVALAAEIDDAINHGATQFAQQPTVQEF